MAEKVSVENVDNFPSTNCKSIVQEEFTLNLNKLKEKPRKIVQIEHEPVDMANNGRYLICFPEGKLTLIDVQGKELLTIDRDFAPRDVCWSSHLNQFLIFTFRILYSLEKQRLVEIMKFNEDVSYGTCFDQTLAVCINGQVIEIYSIEQPNGKLLERFDSPLTCDPVAIKGKQNQVQLRNPTDLKVLHRLNLDLGFYCIQPLPNNEYLLHSFLGEELFLMTSHAKIKQTIKFDRRFQSISLFVKEKCLVVQALHLPSFTSEMRFYHL
ncbi:unnamed protein product [Adineta ricciae]|uniref:Uncharacterized protein n=1 Tax=Adineta ricciae TaxID=249248 RepID=A0A815IC67_ADIRI|nr:unnamed protein product [Adineta ricciae]CAF1366542.1 unnamed protein product [Adineta ricciae]